jgi:4-hydroxybenzoate polyprenyltransferase
MPSREKNMLKAWAQLIRLPNVFTAPADVIAGAALAIPFGYSHIFIHSIPTIAILCAASICFYCAGMILNDVFDFDEDRRDRPFRPLPSGRIHRTTACVAGVSLLVIGASIALSQLQKDKWWPYGIPVFMLPILILAYNLGLKNTFLGPVAMGGCRGLNLLLGSLVLPMMNLIDHWGAYSVMIYITGVTLIAHDETKLGRRLHMQFGIGLIAASAISVSAMIVPFIVSQKGASVTVLLPLLIGWLALLALELIPAYRDPSPANVGKAVKYCIFGLIIMETIHLTLMLGIPGYALLLLLLPAMFLGRFIYST